jgi:hypothetical protein
MSGTITVQGNVSKFAMNSDPVTAGTALFTGALSAAGTLTSASVAGASNGSIVAGVVNSVTVSGSLIGSILGGKSIASATLSGGMAAGSQVSSPIGDIKSLKITGDINGSVSAANGAIASLTFTGSIGATGSVSGRTLGSITVPGAVNGTISATSSLTALKAGSIGVSGNISAGTLGSITTTGDMNGVLNVTSPASPVKLAVGGNYGAQSTIAAPLSLTVTGNMIGGSSITDSNTLTSLAVKGSMSGDVVVDRFISSITAASINNSVITAGLGITNIKVTGAVNNTLVQSGLSRGIDQVFGTGDLGEQGRMADLGTFSAGSVNNSIIAAGGNITTVSSPGVFTNTVVSSGLVVQGSSIATLINGTPLADINAIHTAMQNPTLLHGSIKTVSLGIATPTLVGSSITAGVSPGADGSFGTADDNVNTSITGGNSAITSFKGLLGGGSHLIANSSGGGATTVNYTTDNSASSILQADPITGAPTAIATVGSPAQIITSQGTITITVTGVGGVARAYDNVGTPDRLDTLLISSTNSAPITVTVTTTSANTFGIGRVITTDNTQLANFTFNGDILGDAAGGPSLWIDSDMTSFSIRNIPNDGTWNGVIGGNVGKLTLNQQGPGRLRIGGRVTTLTVATSVGNPLLQQLGTVTPATAITQISYDPVSGHVFATDGTNLLNVDVNTGTISASSPFLTLLTNATVNISGMSFDSLGNLFGVATLNNQNPINTLGQITTAGDTLRGLAINSEGVIYAIDSESGVDTLVNIDPITGVETPVADGTIRDQHTDTFTNNIMALAFDNQDNLLALTNDRDGNGGNFSTSNGMALGILKTLSGHIRLVSPTSSGDPILVNGTISSNFTGMAVDSGGTIYAVENIGGGVQRLDTLTINGTNSTATVARTIVGNIKLGVANTQLVGIGFDEHNNLIGMNLNGTNSELVGISKVSPTASVRLDVPGVVHQTLAGFAVGKSGANFSTYGFTTNATTGGTFFTSPGVVPTLGIISTAGTAVGAFTQMLPLERNALGAPLPGNVTGVAVDSSDNIFVITDQGTLAEYSSVDGTIIGGQPIGTVKDAFGASLDITRIAFDSGGNLIGLNASGDDLVRISRTTSQQNGVNIALASNITELGTADATDLTALSFAAPLGKVLSYSTASGNFVNVLGTTPGAEGGIIANSFGTVALPANFGGHIGATGGGGTAVNDIDSVKMTGNGTFSGAISSDASIGAISGSGAVLTGTIISHGDANSIVLAAGGVTSTGVVEVDGKLNTFTLTGNFAGRLITGQGTTFTVTGADMANSEILVSNDLTTLNINGTASGVISLGSNKTMKITGAISSTGNVRVLGDAGAVTVTGGVQLGGLLLLNQSASNVTIGGTLAGVVAVRKSLTTAVLTNINAGIFAVGMDINSLSVSGNASGSILTSGVWIGSDGIYNTADDVIFGGSINTAKFTGTFTNSILSAGVLPRMGVSAGVNNIPGTFAVYDYNPSALQFADIDGTESGGIGASNILNVTFSKAVASSAPNLGLFSAIAVADSIGKVTDPTGSLLTQIVRDDPPGAPQVAQTIDPTTLLPVPAITFKGGEIRIIFDQPFDTSTISMATVSVTDTSTGNAITDLTFGYFRQTAPDGSTQGVLRIFSNSNFGGATGVTVTLHGGVTAPTIADITGLRSALLDYNQDGVNDPAGDPFGTTIPGLSAIVGPPTNDKLANAITITGFPTTFSGGTNINATAEASESTHGLQAPVASVWYTWVAPSSGPVTVTTDGSDFDTTLSVYQGSISYANLISLGENDNDNAGSTSTVSFLATAGQTYSFAVDGALGATGHIVIGLSVTPPPVNDNLATATVLTGLPVNAEGQNISATSETNEPDHDGTPATNSIWYKWTAPSSGTVEINTDGTNFDTSISVYTGTGVDFASLTSVAEDIDTVTLTVVSGTTYYIAVDTLFGDTGNINLSIISTDPPANDNFANATVITGFPVSVAGNSTFATMQTGEQSNLGATQTTHSVWYSWTAPTTGLVTIDTIGSSFDTTIGVYTGTTLTNLSLLAADDQSGGNNTSLLSLNVVSGQLYYISVSSWLTTDGGNIVLRIH